MKELTSLQHPLVKHLAHLRQNRDYREDHQALLLEGIKPIQELDSKHIVKTVLTTDINLVPKNIKGDVYIVSDAIIKKISGLTSPEGLVAEVSIPKPASLKGLKYIVACEEINDPGNLGTILRTALALGWEGAFILNNSCDLYNEKTIRASRGAVFKLPIALGSWDDLKKIINENKLKALSADIEGTSLKETNKLENALLILGNESRGPSEEAVQNSTKVKIPMPGKMESLNVAIAGGILMYALKG